MKTIFKLLMFLLLLGIIACEKETKEEKQQEIARGIPQGIQYVLGVDTVVVTTIEHGDTIIGSVKGHIPYANYILGMHVTRSDGYVMNFWTCPSIPNTVITRYPKSTLLKTPGTYFISVIFNEYKVQVVERVMYGDEITVVYK